jgi:hypothetical protein
MTAKEGFAISGGDSMGWQDGHEARTTLPPCPPVAPPSVLVGALGGEMRFGGLKMQNQKAADKSVRAPLEDEETLRPSPYALRFLTSSDAP